MAKEKARFHFLYLIRFRRWEMNWIRALGEQSVATVKDNFEYRRHVFVSNT